MNHDHDHHHDHDHAPSRRALLKGGLATVAGQAAIPFALNLANMGAAAAQTNGNDYKALICLFLKGGNDHSNTVIATNGDSWNNYQSLRSNIALPAAGETNGVLPITPGNLSQYGNAGLTLALHPNLKATSALFKSGKLAVVSNVGPLIEPTTADEYRRGQKRVPSRLYSHNDQQSTWQTFSPEGSQIGWGGRLVDRFNSSFNASNSFFSAVAPGSSPDPWLTGAQTIPYAIPSSGRIGITQIDANLGGIQGGGQALRDLLMQDRTQAGHLEHTLSLLQQRTIRYQKILEDALVPENHPSLLAVENYPNSAVPSALMAQIRMIARIIASRDRLNVRRQVFFIEIGGFDTHNDLVQLHGNLMARLDQAIDFFARQMAALNVENNVTLFTASDFGRSNVNNGSGSDHGWGSHHFVVGGAVNGGKVYGKFPVFGIDAGHDVRGRLVPGHSVEQYAAALGTWFGLSTSELMEALPNLGNFDRQALRFMKT